VSLSGTAGTFNSQRISSSPNGVAGRLKVAD
jgi:hypothetical protein